MSKQANNIPSPKIETVENWSQRSLRVATPWICSASFQKLFMEFLLVITGQAKHRKTMKHIKTSFRSLRIFLYKPWPHNIRNFLKETYIRRREVDDFQNGCIFKSEWKEGRIHLRKPSGEYKSSRKTTSILLTYSCTLNLLAVFFSPASIRRITRFQSEMRRILGIGGY